MRKVLLVVALVAAVACVPSAAGGAASDPVFAGQCGIRAQQTVWGEYGWPTLLPILAKPGTLLAAIDALGHRLRGRRRGRAAPRPTPST